MNENMLNVIDDAIRTKRFVGGLGRLKRDGSVVKINGQIFQRRTNTKTGDILVLIDNFLGNHRVGQTKRWQLVLLSNLIELNENAWHHSKAA